MNFKRITTIILLAALGVFILTRIDRSLWQIIFGVVYLNFMYLMDALFIFIDYSDDN